MWYANASTTDLFSVIAALTAACCSLAGVAVWSVRQLLSKTIPEMQKSFSLELQRLRRTHARRVKLERSFLKKLLSEMLEQLKSSHTLTMQRLDDVSSRLDPVNPSGVKRDEQS